jgi:hypothetical protein
MLVGNGVRSGGNPCRFLYGAGTGAHAVERSTYNQHGAMRTSLCGPAKNTAAKTAGYPNGYENGGAWCLPRKGGGMSSHNRMFGVGDLSAAMQTARNLEAALSGSGNITSAELALIISFFAALGGAGDLTGAISGSVKMEAALTGSGGLTADMGAIISLFANLTGSGTLDGSNLTGLAHMAASILSYGDLTPEGLRDAVWGALLESGFTAQDLLRLAAGGAAGKLSGAASTTVVIRDVSDLHDLITATVDADGNRSAITLDTDQ